MQTIPAKTIVTRNKSLAWFGCEYNMNLYRGCCHGCLYCDSRSDCYHNTDFDTVKAKEGALAIVGRELAAKAKTGVVATGAMSDPYNPFEAGTLLTRHALELISAYGFGAAIATKSPLITRDIDVLTEISAAAPVLCKITITTPHDALAQKLEPGVAPSSARFEALQALSAAGLFCGVLLMPVLPFLQDSEADILQLVQRAAQAGARFIHPSFGVTQRPGQREYLHQKLEEAFPGQGLAQRYRQRFGSRYYCASPNSRALWQAFTAECDRHGLLYDMPDIIRAYRAGHKIGQLSLFDV